MASSQSGHGEVRRAEARHRLDHAPMKSPHSGHSSGPAAYTAWQAGHVRVSFVTSTTAVAHARAFSSRPSRYSSSRTAFAPWTSPLATASHSLVPQELQNFFGGAVISLAISRAFRRRWSARRWSKPPSATT